MQVEHLASIPPSRRADSVGFTAFAAAQDVTGGATVPFNDLLFNDGGFYSATDSSFYCPQNGNYLFTVSAFTSSDLDLEMTVGEEVIGSIRQDEQEGATTDSQSATTVVAICGAGQVVRVRARVSSILAEDGSTRRNVFSGFLIGLRE